MRSLKAMRRRLREGLKRKLRGPNSSDRFNVLLRSGAIVMGEGSYGEPRLLSWSPSGQTFPHLVVGKYCSIAEEVTCLVNAGHNVDWVTTYPVRSKLKLPLANADGHPVASGPIVIGSDVWIGFGATILGGVKISDGAVIGAGAIVTRDVAPYAIVVGNPAREVRRRFDDDVIARLLELKWWDLEERSLAGIADLLCSPPDIELLEERVREARSFRD